MGASFPTLIQDLSSLAGFTAAVVVLALTPGPDNLAILSLGISRGRAAAVGFALGCAAGCVTHIGWAILGVAALLKASPRALGALKIAGALYLAYLGIMALRSKGAAVPGEAGGEGKVGADGYLQHFGRGFVANAINPKVAIFFLAFLPPFLRPDAPATPQMLTLGLLFIAVTILVFVPLGLSAAAIGQWLRRWPSAALWLDRGAGVLFLGLAAYVLLG